MQCIQERSIGNHGGIDLNKVIVKELYKEILATNISVVTPACTARSE